MQNQFELPVVINVRPSPWLVLWIYLVHLGAIPAVLFSGMQTALQTLVIALVLASLYVAKRKYTNPDNPDNVHQVVLNEADEWWLTMADKRIFTAELRPAALVHPLLTVLCFRSKEGNFPVILTPDPAQKDDLRRLRVRLRFQRYSV